MSRIDCTRPRCHSKHNRLLLAYFCNVSNFFLALVKKCNLSVLIVDVEKINPHHKERRKKGGRVRKRDGREGREKERERKAAGESEKAHQYPASHLHLKAKLLHQHQHFFTMLFVITYTCLTQRDLPTKRQDTLWVHSLNINIHVYEWKRVISYVCMLLFICLFCCCSCCSFFVCFCDENTNTRRYQGTP
jgi:hypothetical protein